MRKFLRRILRRQKYNYHQSRFDHRLTSTVRGVQKFQWKYRNLIFLTISVLFAYFMLQNAAIISYIEDVGHLGYIGAFISGTFFSYGLTTPPATAATYILGKTLNPFLIAFIGAFGALMSDFLIFRFVRDNLLEELETATRELKIPTEQLGRLKRSKTFLRIAPVIAGFILASPLPDELAAALFALTNYNPKHFAIFSYTSNFLGLLAISWLGFSL